MIHRYVLGRGLALRMRELPRRRLAVGVALGLVAAVLLLIVLPLGYGAAYSDRVFPGVHVGGLDLGGLSEADARARLTQATTLPAGQMVLRAADGSRQWTYTLRDLGVSLDVDSGVANALAYGRDGNFAANGLAQVGALLHGATVAADSRTDSAVVGRVVTRLAADVDRAAVTGSVATRDGTVVVTPGQDGIALDREGAARAITAALAGGDLPATLDLPLRSVHPAVGDAVLQATGAQARALTGAPVVVRVDGTDASQTLSSADLQSALSLDPDATGNYTARFDRARVVALLAPLAAKVAVAPENATLKLVKGKPVLTADKTGQELDLDSAAQAVLAAAQSPGRSATLAIRPATAAITAAGLEPVQKQWTALLAKGFTLHYGKRTWTIKGSTLAGSLALVGSQGGSTLPYRLQLDSQLLTKRLAAIAGDIDIGPRSARFRIVNGTVKIVAPAREGLETDQTASAAAVLAALEAGEVQADLVVKTQPAPVTIAPPAGVSTPDLLAHSSTTYYGSSPERAHNVEFGTSLLDGTLVPPGGEFNTNATLGPLTLAAGFQMGFGIVSDGVNVTTVPAEAGGICQVVTTLFHSVFWAGLPVTERNHHSYWISSYGKPPSGLQGLDATIAPPEKNFRWVNSTGNWILVRAHAAKGVVNFELWGTDPGWKVQVDGPVITKVVPTSSRPIYENSYDMRWGTTRMIEHAQNGFTSDIHRRVYDANGKQIDDWHAQGTYLPAHNRYLVGQKGKPAPTATPDPAALPTVDPALTPGASPVVPGTDPAAQPPAPGTTPAPPAAPAPGNPPPPDPAAQPPPAATPVPQAPAPEQAPPAAAPPTAAPANP
jgi:vancomycin resistance protein YoaR